MTGRRLAVASLLILLPFPALLRAAEEPFAAAFEIRAPDVVLAGIGFKLEVVALDAQGRPLLEYAGRPALSGVDLLSEDPSRDFEPRFEAGVWTLEEAVVTRSGTVQISVRDRDATAVKTVRAIPGLLSILPPLLAIVLALLLRQVLISLFAGIWLGSVFLFDYDPIGGVFRVADHFVVNALSDPSHVQIVVFSLLFGGMVGVITRNGGTRGIASLITRFATTPRGGQMATWGTSFVLFFDDYANVLVRGNLMRPITDQLRISREKLAFLVDTGAATVASIFLISTWIGYEVGLIEQGLRAIDSPRNAYSLFIETIPYRFYPILALILALLVSVSGRDFGPMLAAERRTRKTGRVLREGAQPVGDLAETALRFGEDKPARWYNGLLPILVVLMVGLAGLYTTGIESLREEGPGPYGLGEIVSNADSYRALLWASLSGCLAAILLSLVQRILSLATALEAWFNGLKSMLLAMIILVLAWSIGAVTEELHTAHYLAQILKGTLSPFWLPALTFLIAAAMSFATGTSWGTMAILMPLVIPLAHNLGLEANLQSVELDTILGGVISSVLAGAVFGDHCSPISDTTILSSMASACDHIDHVRTQLPYAVLAAVVGVLLGDIPTAYGLSPWISIAVGAGVLAAVLYLFGTRVEDTATGEEPSSA